MAEYNAKYNADYNADHNAKYNTEYNAEFVTKLYYREYYPEWDPDSDSVIPSYTTTVTIDDCKLTSESSPPIDIPHEAIISRRRSNDFQKDGDDLTGISNNPYNGQLPYRKCRNEAPWDTFTD
jgi:hypothetical protein